MSYAYQEDLAYIHDQGHVDVARHAAGFVLEQLRRHQFTSGLVVDLGCGSGIFAEKLTAVGYDVVGIDQSPAMIQLAQQRVPQGQFHVGSFLEVELPACIAVTAIGECFNYLFDENNTQQTLISLLERIYHVLSPGGLLVFDVAVPGRVPGSGPSKSYREGEDWAVLVTAQEDEDRILTRKITSFRKVGELYRRSYEEHRLRLYQKEELQEQLQKMGFSVHLLDNYGSSAFPPGLIVFSAYK